jgi:hypothetical protein
MKFGFRKNIRKILKMKDIKINDIENNNIEKINTLHLRKGGGDI